ncbi:MAG: four helix bundle protein [Vicinamibacterales bacterium]
MVLVERVYDLSRGFPPDERFGLTSQVRRAAVSIPSNIGEGSRRKRRKAYLNHLDIALGSQGEVEVLRSNQTILSGNDRPPTIDHRPPTIDHRPPTPERCPLP